MREKWGGGAERGEELIGSLRALILLATIRSIQPLDRVQPFISRMEGITRLTFRAACLRLRNFRTLVQLAARVEEKSLNYSAVCTALHCAPLDTAPLPGHDSPRDSELCLPHHLPLVINSSRPPLPGTISRKLCYGASHGGISSCLYHTRAFVGTWVSEHHHRFITSCTETGEARKTCCRMAAAQTNTRRGEEDHRN